MRKLLTVCLAALSIAACGGDSSGPKATINGTWSGTITTSGSSATMTLTLQQGGTSVTGNGSLAGSGASAALTVTGSFTAPSYSLTIESPGYEPINYAGDINGKTMTGTMNGSGFTNISVTLTRP